MQPEEDTTLEERKVLLQESKQDADELLKGRQLDESERHNMATESISRKSKQ